MDGLTSLGVTDSEKQGICNVLAAILHLCYAEATHSQASRAQFVRASNAQQAAALLGISADHLATAVFRGNQQGNVPNSIK